MIFREIVPREPARLEQYHREGVTQRDRCRRAGGGRELERARLARHAIEQLEVSTACEVGGWIARKGHDAHPKAFQDRHESENLLGLTAVAQEKRQIDFIDQAEIAVQRLRRIEETGGHAGAVE